MRFWEKGGHLITPILGLHCNNWEELEEKDVVAHNTSYDIWNLKLQWIKARDTYIQRQQGRSVIIDTLHVNKTSPWRFG